MGVKEEGGGNKTLIQFALRREAEREGREGRERVRTRNHNCLSALNDNGEVRE